MFPDLVKVGDAYIVSQHIESIGIGHLDTDDFPHIMRVRVVGISGAEYYDSIQFEDTLECMQHRDKMISKWKQEQRDYLDRLTCLQHQRG